MFAEDDLLPISALQHLLFCERQCALIHIERLWAENRFTTEGRHLHDKADRGKGERRKGLRVARAVPLRSFSLGLFGQADVVEFHQHGAQAPRCEGKRLPPRPGMQHAGVRSSPAPISTQHPALTTAPSAPLGTRLSALADVSRIPFPVEYKRGKPKKHNADRVQLCAQGLCLEEMLGVAVPAGALFYGKVRRRLDVALDAPLRRLTIETAGRLHNLIASGHTPSAVREKKCDRCSLLHLCLPEAMSLSPRRAASRYLERVMGQSLAPMAGPVGE